METAQVGGPAEDPKQRELKTLATVVYVLQAIGFFNGITWIVGVVINYVKREDAAGSWLESHFTWQIRTFWWGLVWGVVGAILCLVFIGFFVLGANAIWIIYRIIKGALALNEGKPLYLENRASSG